MFKKTFIALAIMATSSLAQAALPSKADTPKPEELFLTALTGVCENCSEVVKYISNAENKKCNKDISVESLRDTASNSEVFTYLLALKSVSNDQYKQGIKTANEVFDCNDSVWAKNINEKMNQH